MKRENPRYDLWFDGATPRGTRGTGGCGAVYYNVDRASNEPVDDGIRISRQLGNVTSDVAKYNGLILGLRSLLREHPIRPFDVEICGDSQVVIKQLEGKLEVPSPELKIYHEICIGLLSRVKGSYSLNLMPRNMNFEANRLATSAVTKKINIHDLVFLPSVVELHELRVFKKRKLIVGTDWSAQGDTNEFLFDAMTVIELFGKAALHDLKDPGACTILLGKVNMTIVGILQLPIECALDIGGDDFHLTLTEGVVVDALPYDAQISIRNPITREALKEQQHRLNTMPARPGRSPALEFGPTYLMQRFRDHPFWSSI
eukprot:jgi/Psemu1/10647/gm1.10647_g